MKHTATPGYTYDAKTGRLGGRHGLGQRVPPERVFKVFAYLLGWKINGKVPIVPDYGYYWGVYPARYISVYRRVPKGYVGKIGCKWISREKAEQRFVKLAEYLGYEVTDDPQ